MAFYVYYQKIIFQITNEKENKELDKIKHNRKVKYNYNKSPIEFFNVEVTSNLRKNRFSEQGIGT